MVLTSGALTAHGAVTEWRLTGGVSPSAVVLDCLLLVIGGGAAVYGARCRVGREAELIHVAQCSRDAVLRPLGAEVDGVGFSSLYRAVSGVGLGGDLYDLAPSPYGPRVLIGDVRGHGPKAAALCAATVGAFREGACSTPALVDLAAHLDARISGDLGPEDFVTVLLGEFAPGEVRLVNCGHPAPLRIGLRAEPLTPIRPSAPLGLDPLPQLQRARLGVGERLLLYTDGLSEARDAKGTMLPLDDRVRQAACRPRLPECLDALLSLATAHAGGALQDDLALIMCEPRCATPTGDAGRTHDSPVAHERLMTPQPGRRSDGAD
ncbi:serine/threonine-protein phosphatase [Streptomyces durmitorensis]|uniref:Serine/threonine-protein phosphatase n=1 Tax=Streptomyces durmitorensis TaxID=319947 RepID=A0ABY4Q2A1_9ACTN|nr:PP2C family protein-serine/threonine phosphatase [Streptomyces durmitorensis]UQT59289.1 serine/threonine-protein phosphatase [Streptomyces durmitorensis]